MQESIIKKHTGASDSIFARPNTQTKLVISFYMFLDKQGFRLTYSQNSEVFQLIYKKKFPYVLDATTRTLELHW